MDRVACLGSLIAVIFAVLGASGVADACTAVRATARIDTVVAPCADGEGGALATTIHVVTGTVVLSNKYAHPTLGSLVVELQARENGDYVPVGRHVINGLATSSVNTCGGSLSEGPLLGSLELVDANGDPTTFDQMKNIPSGKSALRYVATFVGQVPEISPGERVRVKTYTTVGGLGGSQTCTTDADSDGDADIKVRTFSARKVVRVPSSDDDLVAAVEVDTQFCPQTAYCGDGLVNRAAEECDDANYDQCDGCSPNCKRRSAATASSA